MNVFGKMIRVDIVMKKIHPVIQKNKLVMLIVAMHIKTKVLVMVKVNVFGTLQNPNVINQMQLVVKMVLVVTRQKITNFRIGI